MVSFSATAARGLIREPKVRRKMMIGAVLVAALLAVFGATFLKEFLNPREHPFWFIAYWLACAWMTILAILLAIFDLLLARAQVRGLKREMREELAKAARLQNDE